MRPSSMRFRFWRSSVYVHLNRLVFRTKIFYTLQDSDQYQQTWVLNMATKRAWGYFASNQMWQMLNVSDEFSWRGTTSLIDALEKIHPNESSMKSMQAMYFKSRTWQPFLRMDGNECQGWSSQLAVSMPLLVAHPTHSYWHGMTRISDMSLRFFYPFLKMLAVNTHHEESRLKSCSRPV